MCGIKECEKKKKREREREREKDRNQEIKPTIYTWEMLLSMLILCSLGAI